MKNFITEMCSFIRSIPINYNLKMKITAILFVFAFVQINAANSFGQNTKVSLKMNEVSIQNILDRIEQKTDYKFLYEKNAFQNNKIVSVNVKNKKLSNVLDNIFEDQNVTLVYLEKQIIIKPNHEINIVSLPKNLVPETSIDQQSVSGIIQDENGIPLPGASVLEKGTTNGTQTDFNGNFTLNVKDGAILEISYLGFIAQEIAVTGQSTINVTLKADTAALDEVVVVGFGTQKKSNITGSSSSIKMDPIIADRPVTNPMLAIQGVIPGLQITSNSGRPGATGLGINIRGSNSINGGSPLILMDNVQVNTEDINPQDVESITVLKDAAASSIYGARAAFGVILITTKKGKKNQPVKFNYSNTFSYSSPEDIPEKAKTYDFINALDGWGVSEFWTGQNIDTWVGFLDEYKNDPSTYPMGYTEFNGLRYPLKDTDLIGAFLNDDGFSQIHNVNFSGGSEKTVYRISGAFSDDDGIIVGDNDSYKKYNVNASLTTELTEKLTATANIVYRNSIRYDPVGSYGNAISFNPYTPEGGNHVFDDGTEIPYDTPANAEALKVAPKNLDDNIRLFTKFDYNPIEGLTLSGEYTFEQGGRDRITGDNQVLTVNPERFVLNAVSNDRTFYQKSSNVNRYHATNLYAKFEKSIKDHNFSVLAGFNNEKKDFESFFVRKTNLISVDLPSISGASGTLTGDDAFWQWSVLGYFGRLNYNFKEKYFLEVNGRYDGSSRFQKNDRYGFFPSFSAGWDISKEAFMDNVDWVSNLKLRASYGEIGNQDVRSGGASDYYPAVPGMSIYNASWLNTSSGLPYVTIGLPGLVSSSFTWEKVVSNNLGFDARFFNGRLATSFDIYTRETIDMLDDGSELPAILGAPAPQENVADLKANGWEIEVNWRDNIGDFNYNIGFTIFDNQTKMTKVRNETGLYNSFYVGKTFGEIWGYETDGFYTVDDFVDGTLNADLTGGTLKDGVPGFKGRNMNPGDIKFKDLNGDGYIFSGDNTLEAEFDANGDMVADTGPGDRRIIGNTTKRYQYGIFGGASYKNFDFSFLMNGVGKKDIYMNNATIFPYINEFNVVYKDQLDYWTPDNTDAFLPRNYALGGVNYGLSRSTQTKYLLDGSYLRIKNITVGYTIPKEALSAINIDTFRIYLAGENVLDFDNLPDGVNTELQNQGGGATYPYLRSFSLGINLTF